MNVLEYHGKGIGTLVKSGVLICDIDNPNQEELLVEGLVKAIEHFCFELHLKGFSNTLNNKVNCCYGEGFTYKFNYAQLERSVFIKKMLTLFNLKQKNKDSINEKLNVLLSMFNDVVHDGGIKMFSNVKALESDLFLYENHMLNWKATQEQNLYPDFFKSENFNKPEVSFFTDASVNGKTFCAGYGVSRETINVTFRFEDKTPDNNIAEMLALKNAMLIAKSMNLTTLEVFTDSSVTISFLKKDKKLKPTYEKLVLELKDILSTFENYNIAWIPRKKNRLADRLSKIDFPNQVCVSF